MAFTYSNRVEGASAIRALPPGTLIASATDGRDHSEKFEPAKAPAKGTPAADIFPAIERVTPVSGRAQDGPGRLILTTGASFTLHPGVAVVTVSGTA
jgi:hypothetical protein